MQEEFYGAILPALPYCAAGLLFLWAVFRPGRSVKKMPVKIAPPGCRLFYTDQKETKKRANVVYGEILFGRRYGLKGKPDYIFQHVVTGSLVPVEIKSGSIGESTVPHSGDKMQLIAYFLLLEDVFHKKPRYGRLVYRDCMFEIKNTAAHRRQAKKTLTAMRRMLRTGEGEAAPQYAKCRRCICQGTVCRFCEK